MWLARNDYHFRVRRPCVDDVIASLKAKCVDDVIASLKAKCVDDVIASLKANICFSIRCHFRRKSGKICGPFLSIGMLMVPCFCSRGFPIPEI